MRTVKRFLHTSLIVTAICLVPAFGAHAKATNKSSTPRGYFISIDGLQPKLLESYVGRSEANPKGFVALWNKGAVYTQATPPVISITAASHAGIATCSTPARHGIMGNHFLRNHKKVSGFKESLQSETFWEAARRQGRKVASFGYVAMDGTTPARTADLGISYPDESHMGKPAIVTVARGDVKPVDLDVVINPEKSLKLPLHFVATKSGSIVKYEDFRGEAHQINLPGAAEAHAPANLMIHDGERLRRIVIRLISGQANTYAVSRASYNDAHPETFRRSLDDAGLVWPDVNIKGLDLALSPTETVAMQGLLDSFLTDIASRAIPEFNPDIVLFYQPLLDSTGHGFQNKLPNSDNLNSDDPVTAAYRAAFHLLDNNLAKVLATAQTNDHVALMGDHGMTATTTNLNVAPVLPAGTEELFDVYASDAMLFLYPKTDSSDAAAVKKSGEAVRDALAKLQWRDKPVIEMVAERANFNANNKNNKSDGWQYGDAVWAFRSEDGIWFNNNSLDKNTFLPAKVPGMHGQNPASPAMHTALMFSGPGVKAEIHRTNVVSLIQAVPTFARLLKLNPPKDCEGVPVF